MEPHSLKLTIKLKREKSVSNSLETNDHLSNAEEEPNASNSSYRPGSLDANTQNQVDFSSAGALEDHSRQDDGKQPFANSQYQVVLYNTRANGSDEAETPDPANGSDEAETPDPISDRPPSAAPRQHPRALPSVGAFAVQCANCFKWRLIPTQEKYEEIREHIIEQPFFCGKGKDWRPDISCDDPPDLVQDGSRLWAIDKPSIAQPPPGWQRLLKFRGIMLHHQARDYVQWWKFKVQPVSWTSPCDVDTDLQPSRPGHLTDYSEPLDVKHEIHSAKKRNTPPSKIRANGDSRPNPVKLNLGEAISFDRSP